MTTKRYKRKSNIIEAIRFDKMVWEDESLYGEIESKTYPMVEPFDSYGQLTYIKHSNGVTFIEDGNYIIKEEPLGYYSCDESVFYLTHNPLDE